MSLREWLIAIGALVILVIVIDGLRRMHLARKDEQIIGSGMGADELDDSPLDDDFNPELPNGGARPVSPEVLAELEPKLQRPEKLRSKPIRSKPTRPIIGSFKPNQEEPAQAAQPGEASEPLNALDDDDDVFAWQNGGATKESEESFVAEAAPSPGKPLGHSPAGDADKPTASGTSEPDTPPAGANRPEPEEVFAAFVLAPEGAPFKGPALDKLFTACGLEYGDRDIYHRHEEVDTRSPVQFSVASAVEPGTFKPSELEALETAGISFFMSLPGPSDPLKAYNYMIETAQAVARNLGGELKDERRSVMTSQTIEHGRQRIREYERKRRFPRG